MGSDKEETTLKVALLIIAIFMFFVGYHYGYKQGLFKGSIG